MKLGKRLILPLALFFAFSILARQITGVPSAQVEILKSLHGVVGLSEGVQQDSKNTPNHIAAPYEEKSSSLSSTPIEDSKTTYKKYVFSDRVIEKPLASTHLPSFTLGIKFQDLWLLSNLPQVIHAQAPPSTPEASNSLISENKSGVKYIEEITYSGCWRVCLLIGRP